MNKTVKKCMVMKLDPDGLPRAWGLATNEAAARAESERQLEKYRAKKREVHDDYLANAEYTEQVEWINEDEPPELEPGLDEYHPNDTEVH